MVTQFSMMLPYLANYSSHCNLSVCSLVIETLRDFPQLEKFVLTACAERALENQSPGLDKRLVGIPEEIRALTIGLASARVTFTRLLEIVIC